MPSKPRRELFILCANPKCERVVAVRRPSEQRSRRFCSQRCNGLVNQNIRGAGVKGGAVSGQRRQRRVLERLHGLSQVQCFRLGYLRGLQSKLRQIRRRYRLVPLQDRR